ncbi:hypothetical protein H4R33_001493 [Dimargaris cristalligena]|nr:hypothetical protein H4R33_001493 [Dimargaris cristalligena]
MPDDERSFYDRNAHYRGNRRLETPSHPGGLSASAQERLRQRHRQRYDGQRGLEFSSSHQSSRRRRASRSRSRSRSRSPHRGRTRLSLDGSSTQRRTTSRTRDSDGRAEPPASDSRELRAGSSYYRTGNYSDPRPPTIDRRPRSPVRRSAWDQPTPQVRHGANDGGGDHRRTTQRLGYSTQRREPISPEIDRIELREEALQDDRDWYNMDESGALDMEHNSFTQYVEHDALKEQSLTQRTVKRQTARQLKYQQENDKWESNRLQQSGLASADPTAPGGDDDDEDANRVHLLVHDLRPPFLEGQEVDVTGESNQAFQVVRDPTSDLAKLAVTGSKLVREVRERVEKQKATREALNMAGSTLGNVMGMPSSEAQEGEEEGDPSLNPATDTGAGSDQTGASDFARSKSMREQREFLPAFAVRDELMQIIRDNPIVVVVGQTGSGKTTQLAQYLFEEGYGQNGIIGCTQPRRVAAMSVADRVSQEMGVPLGQEVGYTIRFEDKTSDQTKIKYMTAGVLLRESLTDSDLDKYSCLIMDEAHERSLETDVLLGLLKRIVTRRLDLRIIVTSATMNAERFAEFFGMVPTFTIPGRTFPVQTFHSQSACTDYVKSATNQALKIHINEPVSAGDILIFMTGQEDIDVTCREISDRLADLDGEQTMPPLRVLPMYSQLPADQQAEIFKPAGGKARKCVVSTNVAETSLTLDGITYVIDSGFCKLKVYNPRIGMDALQITPITQANANQREGRAGRTGPGVCYRLFTRQAFDHEMFTNIIPEIQRTNLANVVLLLKSLGVVNILDFDFMDAPSRETIHSAMYQLWILGALDNLGGLTPLGRKMVQFPLDPALCKMLLTADTLGCTAEVVTIVSMLSVPSVFHRPKERLEESDAAREKFFVSESDHLTLLNVYNLWKSNGYRNGWCVKHFINPKAMLKAHEIRTQLVDIMKSQRLPYTSSGADWDVIRRCICSAYFHHAVKQKGLGQYINCRTGQPSHLHPTSALNGLGYTPDYLVYHELVLTTKEYMQCVTAVDPHWLAELGPMFFSVKEANWGHLEARRKTQREQCDMQEELRMATDQQRLQHQRAKDDDRQRIATAPSRLNIATPGLRTQRSAPTPRRRFGL